MSNALILWPNYADAGVTYTPTYAPKASWPSPLPLSNIADRRLHKPARSQGVLIQDTRQRIDMGTDRSIRGVAIPKQSLSLSGKWRAILAPSTMLFDYEAGDDIGALGGTFSRTPTATVRAATYTDAAGVLRFAGENRLTRSEDFSHGDWTASSITVAANSVAAPDGATTADSLTASGSNGTIKNAVTTTAVTWTFSVWLQRKTGSGNVDITMDGSTFVTKTLTTDWQRFSVSQTGVAGTSNPGIRIATSGDAVYAWGAQAEIGSSATSYLATTSAAVSAPRDSHYPVIGGARTYLHEGVARTNLCLRSEDFGTTWSGVGTPTRSAAAHTASGVTLDLIGDDDGAALEGYTQTVTFTGDAIKAVSLFVKASTSTSAVVRLRDTSASADRLLAAITWSGGLPVVTMTTGTSLGYQALAGSVFRILFYTTSVTAANTNSLQIYPATDAALATTATGNVYVGGVQAENALFPSSYIPTTSASVARAADLLSFQYAAVPQAATAYSDCYFYGAVDAATNYHVWCAGDGFVGDPYWKTRVQGSNLTVSALHDNGPSLVQSDVGVAAFGNRLEFRNALASTGTETGGLSIDGGAESVGTTSSTATLAAAWQSTTIYVGSQGVSGAQPIFMALRSIRITPGVQTLATMQSVVSDSGWLDAWPAGATAENTEGMNLPLVYLPSTAFTARYCSLQFSDTSNSAGYVDIGRVMVCGGIQAITNISNGASLEVDSDTTREVSDGGAAYYKERPRYRRLQARWDDISESEAMTSWLDFMRIAGTHKQVFVVFNPADTTYMYRRSFCAVVTKPGPLQMPYGTYHALALEFTEEL